MRQKLSQTLQFDRKARLRSQAQRPHLRERDTVVWLRRRGMAHTKELTSEELEQYRMMFELLDRDASGTIDLRELVEALHELGMGCAVAESLLKAVAVGSQREIGFHQFVELCSATSFDNDALVEAMPAASRVGPAH